MKRVKKVQQKKINKLLDCCLTLKSQNGISAKFFVLTYFVKSKVKFTRYDQCCYKIFRNA
ncbi:hypothetical protein BpHYR1_010320 [Brachionus plicatilis]|uniref:Uncharacterized protein n=1 Tax=Brachionus plicatilis TaxID=10195 RepID=A0A3M7Q0B9_BRAPC|nr:hypothetical protein BpHYR1_010320 [Brachionus plicatilis]